MLAFPEIKLEPGRWMALATDLASAILRGDATELVKDSALATLRGAATEPETAMRTYLAMWKVLVMWKVLAM